MTTEASCKSRSIEPIAVSLPMLKPVIMAGEEVRRADNVLVRVETDTGASGWGEAASAPVMTGETLESIVSAIHYLNAALRGRDAADIAGALSAMDGRMYGNHGAKAAIEIALYDLAGRAAGKPVHALLGEKKRNRMPLLGVIGGGDYDGDLAMRTRRRPRVSRRTRSRSASARLKMTPRARATSARFWAAAC